MIKIYRSPEKVNEKALAELYRQKIQQRDFRIQRAPAGQEHLFFEAGSELRRGLTITLDGKQNGLSQRDIKTLWKATPYSIVGEASTFGEATSALIDIFKSTAQDEFLIARSAIHGKTFIMKGIKGVDPDRPSSFMHQVPTPFMSEGPTVHIHPIEINPTPSFGDFYHTAYSNSPFGIVLGYKYGLRPEEAKLFKYYILGPFRTIDIDLTFTRDVLRTLNHTLKNDTDFLRCFYYILRSDPTRLGYFDDKIPNMLGQHREDMRIFGEKISSLETVLSPDPAANFKKAMELAEIYIQTQHCFNALILLEKLSLKGKNDEIKGLIRMAASAMPDLTFRLTAD
jgi:hypothetical protein